MLDYQDYLSEFFMSFLQYQCFFVQSALCLFSNLVGFLFKSLKQLLNNFSWETGEEVRKKHFFFRVWFP